jgi:predicted secreted hydrolase
MKIRFTHNITRKRKFFLLSFCVLIVLFLTTFTLDTETERSTHHHDAEKTVKKRVDVFEPVLPNNGVSLPRDFAFHPSFEHEWWNYTVNLTDDSGQSFALQWTLFRHATQESDRQGWESAQLYTSHIVLTAKDRKFVEERVARGGIGLVGQRSRPFSLWIENWTWRSLGNTPFPGQLDITTDDFSVKLNAVSTGPYILAGDQGYRAKHDLLPVAAFQFSLPFVRTSGVIEIKGKQYSVSGEGWLSKEWGTDLLNTKQQGWDWFTLHLDDGRKLSVTQTRLNKQLPYSYGTLSSKTGKTYQLNDDEIEVHPIKHVRLNNGKKVPVQWIVNVPQFDLYLTTEAVRTEQWLSVVTPYWEGPIQVGGSINGKGFMQLTGY